VKKLTALLFFIFLLFAVYAQGRAAEDVVIDVPYYTQGKEAPWADEKLGLRSGVTIRTHGCALTCIAMVYSHFTGEDINPSVMNNWLKNNKGFGDDPDKSDYSGQVVLNWPALARYGDGWVYTRFNWRALPADLLLVKYYLGRGIPVIAEVIYNGAPHYVVLTGYGEQGFTMHDPEQPGEHVFNEVYKIHDHHGSGPARNIYGIRVLYSKSYQ
jgi:hypothetical protein